MHRWLLILALTVCPGLVQATTFHVAQSGGSDGNSCSAAQNANTAKLTIGAGIGCLSGGDTLIIHAGTYPEQIHDHTIPSGSSGAPTIVKGNGNPAQGTGERAIIRTPPLGGYQSVMATSGHDIMIDGLVLDGINNKNVVLEFAGGPNLTLQNSEIMNMGPIPNDGNGAACVDLVVEGGNNRVIHNKIHDCQNSGDDPNGLSTHCIYTHGNNNTVDGNEIFNCGNHGIQQFNNPGSGITSNGNTFKNNRIYNCAARGILLSSGDNNIAYNNIIYNSGFNKPGGGRGALACTDGNNNQFYNNTVYGNLVGLRAGPQGPNGTVFRNNIVFNNNTDFQTDGSNGTVDDHNLLGVNPLFVNAGAGDFHVQSNSPASNAGVAVSIVTTDFDGNTRGNPPELGAFEIGGAPPQPPTPLPPPVNLRLVP